MSSVSSLSCSSTASSLFNPITDLEHWSGGINNYKILKRHQPEYVQLVMKAVGEQRFLKDLASLVADYVVDGEVFDRQKWLEYYGVDIDPETEEVQEALNFDNFYKTYHAPNPVDVVENVPADKIRQVCESCLTPTVRPQIVKRLGSGLTQDFCLITLGEIAENPIKGPAAKYFEQSTKPLIQHGMIKAGPSALVIMLKGVVARFNPWSKESQDPKKQGQIQYLRNINEKTRFDCRPPDALSQNTVVFAHYVLTNERPLGYITGIEDNWTFGRTIELVENGQTLHQMISGDFSQGNLNVDAEQSNRSHHYIGVVVMRQCPDIENRKKLVY